jgi:hypothetical protein
MDAQNRSGPAPRTGWVWYFAYGLDPSCADLAHLLAGRDLLPETYLRGLAARTCLDGIPERN